MPAKKKTTKKKATTVKAPPSVASVATVKMNATFIVPIEEGQNASEVCEPIKQAAQEFATTFSDRPETPTCALMLSLGLEVEPAPSTDEDGKDEEPADEPATDERAEQVDRLKSAVGLSDAEAERLISIIRGE